MIILYLLLDKYLKQCKLPNKVVGNTIDRNMHYLQVPSEKYSINGIVLIYLIHIKMFI